MRDIGKNIRQLRMQKKMTQDALAESLFVTRQTVSNYETGKSRPDIDMLIKIAEVLGTDINSILYGAARTENRRKDIKSFLTGLSLCIVCAVPFCFWVEIGKRLKYCGNAHSILRGILFPLLMLSSAWTLMQGISLLTKSKPLRTSWSKYIFRIALNAVLMYFALRLPEAIHNVRQLMVGQYIESLRPPYSLASSLKYNPALLSHICGELFMFLLHKGWLFFAMGIVLWLFREEEQSTRSKVFAGAIALLLSLGIYFAAESEFVLGLENPDEYQNVPYGIRVEHLKEQ